MAIEKKQKKLEKPKCVAMIMDGNRRWAKQKNLHTFRGHQAGYNKMKEVIGWCVQEEIPNLILYAFSIENWQRDEREVSYLMRLVRLFLQKELDASKKKGIRISFIGDMSMVPKNVIVLIEKAERETAHLKKLHLVIAFSYSGRREILSAFKEISKLKDKKEIEKFTEKDFSKFLWTGRIAVPEPDFVIRTGGEVRLSNFLLWQSAYSELFFLKTFWPDFSQTEFKKILEEFSLRERRLGK